MAEVNPDTTLAFQLELSIPVAIGNKLMRMSQSLVVDHVMVEKTASNSTKNENEDDYEGLPDLVTFNKKNCC